MNRLLRIYILLTVACLVPYANTGAHFINFNRNRTSFDVVVFGDMPYTLPADYQKFENLLQFVNKQHQAFNVFVGDIKSSHTSCSNDLYYKLYNYFNECNKPLVYTPGDNEWTDCKKPSIKFDPDERLTFLRSVFFNKPGSLGKQKMRLFAESSDEGFSKYVENKRWAYKHILFATVHLVGSNNNLITNDPNNNEEFKERCIADSIWINETFTQAERDNNPCIVLFTHADMFTPDNGKTSGFARIIEELTTLSEAYGRTVLLVNGDSHKFLVDKPLYTDKTQTKTLLNFTRVQVFGEYDVHAVTIHFDLNDPALFSVKQLIVPANQ